MFRRAATPLFEARATHPIAILLVILALIGAGSAAGQCVDYGEYLHATARIDTEGSVQDIAFDGSYLYVADRFHGLLIHDLDSQTVGDTVATFQTPDLAEGLVYRYPYVFMVCRQAGLIIIDVSDPRHPQLAGQLEPIDSAVALTLLGNLAFVADSGFGLLILDVSDPASPRQVGQYAISGGAGDLVLAVPYLFVASGEGLAMIDILDPTNPSSIGYIPLSSRVFAVDVAGSLVFAGTRNLDIISFANPAAPVALASYPQPSTVTDVEADGTLVYVCDFENGLSIFDISDPAAPVLVAGQGTLHNALCLTVDAPLVMTGDTSGLSVFDAANPASVARSGGFELEGPVAGFALSNDNLFVADRSRGLVIVRLDPILGPVEVGRLEVAGGLQALAPDGQHIYAAADDVTLRVIDVTDPTHPEESARIDFAGESQGIAVIGDYACVVTRMGGTYGGLFLAGIESPSNPEGVGMLSMDTSFPTGIATDGVYAYLSDWEEGLLVVDLADPATPNIISSVDTPGHARDVVVQDSRAHVASGKSFQVIDVTDPTEPFTIGSSQLPTEAKRLAVRGNHIYVSTAGSGILVFDVAEPSDIRALGGVAAGEATSALALYKEQLLAGCDGIGLCLYPAQCFEGTTPGPGSRDLRVLLPPTPNPSRLETTIRFDLPSAGDVELGIYDVTGRQIAPLIDGPRDGGSGGSTWDGRDGDGYPVPAGFYLVRLSWDGYVETRRLIRLH